MSAPATIIYNNPKTGLNIWYFKKDDAMLRQFGMNDNTHLFNTTLMRFFNAQVSAPIYDCLMEHDINLKNGYKLIKDDDNWLNSCSKCSK